MAFLVMPESVVVGSNLGTVLGQVHYVSSPLCTSPVSVTMKIVTVDPSPLQLVFLVAQSNPDAMFLIAKCSQRGHDEALDMFVWYRDKVSTLGHAIDSCVFPVVLCVDDKLIAFIFENSNILDVGPDT